MAFAFPIHTIPCRKKKNMEFCLRHLIYGDIEISVAQCYENKISPLKGLSIAFLHWSKDQHFTSWLQVLT